MLALQTSSALLVYYSLGCAAYLVWQNHIGKFQLNDIIMMCLLDMFIMAGFFLASSEIVSQTSFLRKEQIELLQWKKQAVTVTYKGSSNMLKDAMIREAYDDVMVLLKLGVEAKPTLFGLNVETGKWANTVMTLAVFSVGNILFRQMLQ